MVSAAANSFHRHSGSRSTSKTAGRAAPRPSYSGTTSAAAVGWSTCPSCRQSRDATDRLRHARRAGHGCVLASPALSGSTSPSGRRYGVSMRVEASREAVDFVRARGRRLWVSAARPRVCCQGTPAYMHAATQEPSVLSGFSPVRAAGIDVFFGAPAGRSPEVPEIGLRGRRRSRVEAYWDGLRTAL